ncbi:MAG: DUF58 domain-containing protein [Nibricoccus sp.]
MWALIFPKRTQRVSATLPGLVLIGLAVGVGVAAYNSASNILFVTLSLLLGCLVLSGVLSWLNFRRVHWRLEVDSPMRAGREQTATIHLRNDKRLVPSQALVFEVASTSAPDLREIALRDRLDPQAEAQLSWAVKPLKRGRERVELAFVGSLFPFGFLRKSFAAKTACEVTVWPAPVEYRRFPVAAWRRAQPGAPMARAGQSGDLLALRHYRAGDSHRQIHWKASARLRRLVVRQFSVENEESFTLWLDVPASIWKNAMQFETLCSFAATLAEDLFKQGKLDGVAFGGEPVVPVRGVRDLEVFLDRVAVLQPVENETSPARPANKNVLSFSPEGGKGVIAYVDGEVAATA